MTTTATSYYQPTSLDLGDLEEAHGGQLTIDEWRDLFAALGAMHRGHQWWIGDAIVAAENQLGEDAYGAIDELGLEPQTLKNIRWVASAVDTSRRREDLTWSHHAEVARLGPRSQNKMLAEAADKGWTVRELRDAVALRYPTEEQTGRLEGLQDGDQTRARLAEIISRYEAGDDLYRDDIGWLINLARKAVT